MMRLFQQVFHKQMQGGVWFFGQASKEAMQLFKGYRKNTPNFAMKALACKVECMTKTVFQICVIGLFGASH